MYEDQQYQDQEQPQKRHSAAKAAVAQQKPRDNKGHFISGEELRQYRQQQQIQQLNTERQKFNSMLGKSSQPIQEVSPQSGNFRSILRSNTLGNQQDVDSANKDKWDTILGKKKSNIRW